MTEEYLDVFSEKYTKMWKTIAIIRLIIKVFFLIIFTITLIMLCQGLKPYIDGTEEWENMPFTLSQLEAILSLLVMVYLMNRCMKVL